MLSKEHKHFLVIKFIHINPQVISRYNKLSHLRCTCIKYAHVLPERQLHSLNAWGLILVNIQIYVSKLAFTQLNAWLSWQLGAYTSNNKFVNGRRDKYHIGLVPCWFGHNSIWYLENHIYRVLFPTSPVL